MIDQEFTSVEYERIGRYTIRAIGVAVGLGHGSPATLGDYVAPNGDPLQRIVLDAFYAGQIGPRGKAERDRLIEFVNGAPWVLDTIAEAATT